MKKLEDYVVSIPDFPEPGIIFRDITSVLQDADGLQLGSCESKNVGLTCRTLRSVNDDSTLFPMPLCAGRE